MRWLVLRAAVVALAIFALPGFASAQFMTGFTGNVLLTTPLANAVDTSTINYTVYNNTGGTFLTDPTTATLRSSLGTASSDALNADKYIYIYQAVTYSSNGVDQLQVAQPQNFDFNNLYSAGSSGGTNPKGGLTFTGNLQLDGGPVTFSTNSIATDISGMGGGFFAGGGPTSGMPALTATFQALGTGSTQSGSLFTNVLVAGSNVAPTFGYGNVADRFNVDGPGFIPVPGPEPSTFALLALALPVFGFGYSRRLRAMVARKAAVAA